MKKILLFIALVFSGTAHAGPMANVEYIHAVIKQQWGIEVPYNPALENPKVAANMKYLLTAVDAANKMLNGEEITDYGNGEYATLYAVDTIATNDATARLIKIMPKFFITTTADTAEFSFNMSAKGTFMVDWGDGQQELIIRVDTDSTQYTHEYAMPGEYTIGIGGRATQYHSANLAWKAVAAISFSGNKQIAAIAGSLGAILPSLPPAISQQPRFVRTFYNCTNLTSEIPTDLFVGISGTPTVAMFSATFSGCSNISGHIPSTLFAGLNGKPAGYMFQETFNGCKKLSGSIPAKLFATLQGNSQTYSFYGTFKGCSGLSGSIPPTLFIGITGGAFSLFEETFANCTGLNGHIPPKLFQGITTLEHYTFAKTFANCTGLDGEIPGELFENISITSTTIAAPFSATFSGCSGLSGAIPVELFKGIKGSIAFPETFRNCSGITSIPEDLFAGMRGYPPAQHQFFGTFSNTGITSIPAKLFSDISGAPTDLTFRETFANCKQLKSIPDGLFAEISGPVTTALFNATFSGCTELTAIPENLFGDLYGDEQDSMFYRMFYGCTNLKGPSAKINGVPLYEIWPNGNGVFRAVESCYYNDKGLDDYADIPAAWR